MTTDDETRTCAARDELSWLMSLALRVTGADCASVAIWEGYNKHVRLGVVGCPSATLEFVSIDGTSTYCDQVMTTAEVVHVSAASLSNAATGDSFMQASELSTYLGAPITEPGGTVLGAFAVMTREDRIWSRRETEDVQRFATFAAHALVAHARPDTPALARAIAAV